MSTSDSSDLLTLAKTLLDSGPKKTLHASPRRIRILFNAIYIADTTSALYVWEHNYYPTLYIPTTSLSTAASLHSTGHITHAESRADTFHLSVGDKATDRVLSFSGGGALDGMTRIEFKAMDAWFEEDIQILVHPKDPFKRVDVIPSTRTIHVSLQGKVLAETAFAMHLYETLLPTRYYMPFTAIDPTVLRKSATKSECPYKGEAAYYDVVVGGEVYKDLVWYYDCPNMECAGIKGLACFYNEKVDVEVDGKKEERPKTHFG